MVTELLLIVCLKSSGTCETSRFVGDKDLKGCFEVLIKATEASTQEEVVVGGACKIILKEGEPVSYGP